MTDTDNLVKPPPMRAEPEVTAALEPDHTAAKLVRVLDDYLADLQAGKPADRATILAAHPDLASQLEQCLAGIEFIHRAGRTAGEIPAQLGDFRIRREIGRGGMGVVYEAEQLSLHRIVALKILRFGAVADPEALDRFRNEAETVARLHHTNIVPIFAVGNELGVNFYAMQLIEGQSLADVIQRRVGGRRSEVGDRSSGTGQRSRPVPGEDLKTNGDAAGRPSVEAACHGRETVPQRVELQPPASAPTVSNIAGWGLQAAEALTHAHGRGVIHRDIKPSNLLLDNEGTLWLTDFGLAKRIDDIALTLTGAILGTPRYMSPEQAMSTRQPVDHRTDIYSLGATLYELVTGQPVFAAETPHEVISQILATEPRPPRQFDRSLPRDLETIVMKCLAKEPGWRYQTARELADDLRAFLDGRPIAARRLSPLAQATRWAKKHRQTAGVMAGVAASVAVLLIAGFLAWRSHEESLLGQLSLTTSGPSLVAEVLDQDDRPVAPSFPVPTSQPVALHEGSYQLRLSTPGMLSQTYPLKVERGGNHYFEPRLEDRWLWPPMELKPDEKVEPVPFGERTDLLVFRQSDSHLRRLSGATGSPVWPHDLVLDKENLPAGENLDQWKLLLQSSYNPWQSSWLAVPEDLDGDGIGDLAFASRKRPALVAVSGATGKVLWMFRGRAKPDGIDDVSKLRPVGQEYYDVPMIGRAIIGKATGEASPRVVGCFASPGESFMAEGGANISAKPQAWLEAISGKTGRSLWRYPLGTDVSNSQNNRVEAALDAIAQPLIVRVGERQVVTSVAGTKFFGVDLATGREAWPPVELGFAPDGPPQIFAMDGTGPPAALFVSRSPKQSNGSPNAKATATLAAISLADQHILWHTTVDSVQRPQFQFSDTPIHWQDFEVDNVGPKDRPAIVTAAWHIGPDYEEQTGWTHYDGCLDLSVLDPSTGIPRWQHKLTRFGSDWPPKIRWLVGPDLDGDGQREIFVAWSTPSRRGGAEILVSALSGLDGHTLWRWTKGIGGWIGDPAPALSWWHESENGWPQLIVPVAHAPGGQPVTYVLDSANGQLRQTLPAVSDPKTCDLNGDGLLDLLYTVAPQGFARMMAVRGEPPIGLRWLDTRQRHAAQDFDGDGIDDIIIHPDNTAVSGRDGRTLWKSARQMGTTSRPISGPLPLGDLGGEGRPSVIQLVDHEDQASYSSMLEVRAVSGRDGHRLWPADRGPNQVLLTSGISSGSSGGRSYVYPALGLAQFDPRKPADVLVSVPGNLNLGSGNSSQIWLNVVSGATGQLRWKAPVALGEFGIHGRVYQNEFQDLNGDGVADIVTWGVPTNASSGTTPLELKAYSGVDGSLLWPDATPIVGPSFNHGFMHSPVVGKLDGSRTSDVLFVREKPYDDNLQGEPGELVAIGGRDGREKWTWSWVGHSGALPDPLLVDFDGAGRQSVCLFITETLKTEHSLTYQPRVVILDGAGKLRKRIDPKGSAVGVQFYGNQTWWRSGDLRGDGKQELLFFDEGALQALGGTSIEPLWKWPLPWEETMLLDVIPAGASQPATLVVWSGKSIYGLSGATGRPRWRGEMPTAAPLPYSGSPERVWLRDTHGLELPRLLSSDGCRLTWPTDDEGRYHPPLGEPIAYAPVPDPVSLRSLPWTDSPDGPMLAKMIPWSFLWLVVPALLIRHAIRRNSWWSAFLPAFYQLGMMLALKVIPLEWLPMNRSDGIEWDPHEGMCLLTALFLAIHAAWMVRRRLWALVDASAIYAIAIAIGWSQRFANADSDFYGRAFRMPVLPSLFFMVAVVLGGLPFLAGAAFIVAWLKRGKWIWLGLFLIASLVFAAACAELLIVKDRDWMGVDEEYSMNGWWLILIYGAYFAAALALAGSLAKHAFIWCRRRASRPWARFAKREAA